MVPQPDSLTGARGRRSGSSAWIEPGRPPPSRGSALRTVRRPTKRWPGFTRRAGLDALEALALDETTASLLLRALVAPISCLRHSIRQRRTFQRRRALAAPAPARQECSTGHMIEAEGRRPASRSVTRWRCTRPTPPPALEAWGLIGDLGGGGWQPGGGSVPLKPARAPSAPAGALWTQRSDWRQALDMPDACAAGALNSQPQQAAATEISLAETTHRPVQPQ